MTFLRCPVGEFGYKCEDFEGIVWILMFGNWLLLSVFAFWLPVFFLWCFENTQIEWLVNSVIWSKFFGVLGGYAWFRILLLPFFWLMGFCLFGGC